MTFEISALIVLCITVLSIAISYRIKIWCNSVCVEANILGYKWFKDNKTTGFMPVIALNKNDKSIKVKVRKLNLFIPERKVKLRLSRDFKYSVKTDVVHLAFLLTLLIFILYTLYSPNNQNSNNALLLIVIIYTMTILLKLVMNFKNTGRLNIMAFMPISKRPDSYEDMTEDDFKKIEDSDLVTYEEAMAHYYHQNKKSEKWLYPIIGIVIIAAIAYKVFW